MQAAADAGITTPTRLNVLVSLAHTHNWFHSFSDTSIHYST